MGRGAALGLAAALVSLALGAPACKPSSLTPFGIGTRGTEDTGYNGLWRGTTTSTAITGGVIEFAVASGEVTDFALTHDSPQCQNYLFTGPDITAPVEGDTFEAELLFEIQGRMIVQGRFTSSSTCTGTYFFEGIRSTGDCPTADSGTFVATKTQ